MYLSKFGATLIVCCLVSASDLHAQKDSVRTLPQVQIDAIYERLAPVGQSQISADTTLRGQWSRLSIADLLSLEGMANIRAYGAGLTATAGMRGGAANQTSIVWNGFKLPTPLSGLTDFSNLPATFFDRVTVVPGAHSALWGSSAVGGIVALGSDVRPPVGAEIGLNLGSFGAKTYQIKANTQYRRFQFTTRVARREAENNFTYTVALSDSVRRQVHGRIQTTDALQEVTWQPNSQWQIRGFAWVNSAARQIPPTITQTRSVADQADQVLRFATDAQWQGRRVVTVGRLGHFRESIRYVDSAVGTNSLVRFGTTTAELESRIPFANQRHQLHLGATANHTDGVAPGYVMGLTQRRNAVFGSLRMRYGRLQSQFDLRWARRILVPGVSAQYQLGNLTALRTRLGRTFREPVLNELYWLPGGNPDLLSERGWSAEAGFDQRFERKSLKIGLFCTAFYRSTEGQIIWAPVAGSFIWSPANLGLVHTKGIESRMHVEVRLPHNLHLRLRAGSDLISSENQQTLALPRINAGDQLWYVPRVQSFAAMHILWRRWVLHGQRQWFGAVQTPQFPLETLQMDAASLQFTTKLYNNTRIETFLRADNLGNKTWLSINRRPMPGRTISVGIRMCWEK
jgi:vitamin B12 transporter